MALDFTLRPLNVNSLEDMQAISDLYASTRQEEMSVSGWSQEQIDSFLLSQFQSQHTFYMQQFSESSFDLIMVNNVIAGRFYVNRDVYKITIIDIALFPAYRNQKIGERLIVELQKEVTAQQKLTIHVEFSNRAMSFYKRLGFYPISLQGVYILMEWVASSDLRLERETQYAETLKSDLSMLTGFV